MKTQQTYRTDIEFIDKDHVASLFMALCEMNEVYDENAYYTFIADILADSDTDYLKNEILQASIDTEKEVQRQLNEINVWYENQFRIDGDGKKVPKDEWNKDEISAIVNLNNAKNEKIQAVHNNRENIRLEILKNLKKNKTVNDWKNIGLKKVYNVGFKYQSMWSYDDVLNYFKKNGYPIKRRSVIDELESSLNVCKVRHILRNDIMIDEAILLPLLEMEERKKEVEQIKENKKFWQAFMIVFSIIATVVSAVFTGGASGLALVALIVGTTASIGSAIVGVVNMVLDSINEAELKETTQKTNDLMLKNAPKSGNFVDTAITDPYSMYANGRLWKQGAAGRDRYDQMLPHEPYRALDDKFKDSDMFDVLNNKRDKLAGGDQYLSNLYSDGKWVNPSSMKALLNGAMPIYLNMRNKITEAIFKWLTKNDLGTYYLFEDNPDDDDEYWDRYHRIEFEDEDSVKGFTSIVATYYIHKMVDSYDPSGKLYLGKIEVTECVGCVYSVSTKWDKDEDNKTQSKWNDITENARVVLERTETKVLKGSEIELYTIMAKNPYATLLNRKWEIFTGFNGFMTESTYLDMFKYDDAGLKNGDRRLDSNTYYECEYELWSYGGKEVKLYKSIKEVKDYKEGQTSLNYGETLDIRNGKVYTYKCFKYFVREEAKARIRFRAGSDIANYTANDFIKEELQTPCVPYIVYEGSEWALHKTSNVYRYFDRNTRFAHIVGWGNVMGPGLKPTITALADNNQNGYVEVTIFHKKKDKEIKYLSGNRINGTTYFGLSSFLNAKRNITTF